MRTVGELLVDRILKVNRIVCLQMRAFEELLAACYFEGTQENKGMSAFKYERSKNY